MAIIGDALRQAFMPKREYDSLREEEKAWIRLQRPLVSAAVLVICVAVISAASVSLSIVFPSDPSRRPFCRRAQVLPLNVRLESESYQYHGAFYLTDEEAAGYYWMVVFIPSVILFLASALFLIAGISVVYSAPARNPCLRVVENNYCASRRGGMRCLSILNVVFAVVFGLMAMFLGSSLLTLGNSCSLPLFWCYEIASWGLATLYGGTAFLLRRKAAAILDEGGRNLLGLEMSESAVEVERRVNEGFKAWMGSSLLSSSEDEDDQEDSSPTALVPNS